MAAFKRRFVIRLLSRLLLRAFFCFFLHLFLSLQLHVYLRRTCSHTSPRAGACICVPTRQTPLVRQRGAKVYRLPDALELWFPLATALLLARTLGAARHVGRTVIKTTIVVAKLETIGCEAKTSNTQHHAQERRFRLRTMRCDRLVLSLCAEKCHPLPSS